MKPIWQTGERAIDVSPRFEAEVGDPHPRRVNFVAGRTLTAQALELEQTHRDRRFALLGRALVPGIVQGLEVNLVSDEAGGAEVMVSPGSGITHDGEDVVLHRPLSALLSVMRPAEPFQEEDETPVGLVVFSLRPVRAESTRARDPENPCPLDPDAHAYDDITSVDGAELVWSRLDSGEPVSTLVAPQLALRNLRPVRSLRPRMGTLPVRPVVAPLGGALSRRRILLPARPSIGRADPTPDPLTKLRNDTAYRIFNEELEAASLGEAPRWGKHGVPVALAQITREGEVIFLDRFAVARMGGAPRQAAPSDRMGVPLPLRRARFDQFVAHVQDLRSEGAPLAPADQHFRALPPVGVLPATLIDFDTMMSEFFPANFKVEAAPVPIEQFESILARRSGLDPFEFGQPEYVQIIVPVPEHLFEPRLLMTEEISPLFGDAIEEASSAIEAYQAKLDRLQGYETSIIGLVDFESIDTPVSPEMPPLAGGDIPNFREDAQKLAADLETDIKDLPISLTEKAAVANANFTLSINKVSKGFELGEGDLFHGLKPVIEDLTARVEKANDFVDLGFVRLQADIYRARKHLVGEDDATRLATSPVLANLAGNSTGVETADLIRKFFQEQVRSGKTAPRRQYPMKLPTAPRRSENQNTKAAPPEAFKVAMLPNFKLMTMRLATQQIGVASRPLRQAMAPAVRTSSVSRTISAQTSALSTTSITPARVLGSQFGTLKSDLASARLNARSISWQGLAYSKASPVRTVTVADRLKHSPAQEAKNAAVVTKAEIARRLQQIGLDLTDLPLPVSASRTVLVEDEDLQPLLRAGAGLSANLRGLLGNDDAVPVVTEGNGRKVRMLNEAHLFTSAQILFGNDGNIGRQLGDTIPKLFGLRIGLDHPDLPGLILSDRLDPDPVNADEAAYYSAAVDALDSAVSMLRLAEGRVDAYATFLDRAQSTLLEAYDLAETWQGMIEDTEAKLAESRHDHAVAQALLAEEETRIEAIHTRRRDILKRNVDLVGFARPRTVDRFSDAPGLTLYAPLETPVPGCLEADRDPPEELEDMLEDLREAPVGWFPDLADEIGRIDRARRLRDAWERARLRATDWLRRYKAYADRLNRAARQRRVSGKAATGVRLALAASRARWAAMLRARAERPLAELGALGWRALRDRATSELSMEDLGAAGKAGAALAREGLEELDRIGSVAACFLDTLRSVPATIRLQWAEDLSIHDTPPDLSDLYNAPLWGRVGFEERRMLEHLHQWLFSRINASDPEAKAAMSEIVRVCLLLSSHAPVSEIVEGESVGGEDGEREKILGRGGTFQVAVGRGEAGVGWIATFQDGLKRGHGVVDDVVGSNALVRITSAPDGPVSVGANTAVRFVKPLRRRLMRRTWR